jgi:hypothetical protein
VVVLGVVEACVCDALLETSEEGRQYPLFKVKIDTQDRQLPSVWL